MTFDSRLDNRTYDEMGRNIEEWEDVEECTTKVFSKFYLRKHGGKASIANNGFRRKGLEKDVQKTDHEPDFVISFTEGPFKNKKIKLEVQGMKPDYAQFHIKLHKVEKALNLDACFLQMSAIGKKTQRFSLILPEQLSKLKAKSGQTFGVVGFPGTISKDFPEGKPALRFKDDWLEWEYTNTLDKNKNL